MGNGIPRPTCGEVYSDDRQGCNNDTICYYVDNKCSDKVQFYSLNDIPHSDIKCSIYPDTNVSNNYILYCINRNNSKNIVIKSIQVKTCNSIYKKECNILLDSNTIDGEFALKPYMHTFNNVDGELTKRFNLSLDQVKLIKNNNNQITIIDIYDVIINVPVEMYDANYEQTLAIDKDILNQNIGNINKTTVNLNALGLNSLMIT